MLLDMKIIIFALDLFEVGYLVQ